MDERTHLKRPSKAKSLKFRDISRNKPTEVYRYEKENPADNDVSHSLCLCKIVKVAGLPRVR